MSRYYPAWNGIQVLPKDLIKFAWSEPMRDLATKVGISDVGLRKLFISMGIVPPPQGYWNKLRAGKPVPEIPRTPPRQPGTTGRLLVDRRFEHFVPQAQPLSSAGPFTSALVPEDLEELRRIELKAIGKATTPRSLEGAHPGLIYTENLLPEAPTSDEPERPDQRPASAARSPTMAVPLIRRAVKQLEDDDGWVALGGVGQRLAALASDFDPRTFGHAKLGDLVEKTGAFEVRRTPGRGVHIRYKQPPKPGSNGKSKP